MALSADTIQANPGSRKRTKRVGRGNGSQKGTYAGRGLKGQRARSGGKSGGAVRGLKQAFQKVPKKRGFTSIHKKPVTVSLAMLNRVVKDGETVTPTLLQERGVMSNSKNAVKIVATGELSKKITLKDCVASKGAVAAIEKAGGSVTF